MKKEFFLKAETIASSIARGKSSISMLDVLIKNVRVLKVDHPFSGASTVINSEKYPGLEQILKQKRCDLQTELGLLEKQFEDL